MNIISTYLSSHKVEILNMVLVNHYSSFIQLNKNFKDVFSFEEHLDEKELWKRYIFTKSFGDIINRISFMLDEDKGNNKGIILTGKYGVGKSHATGVLSHLLWDNTEDIADLLKKSQHDLGIPGKLLSQFRESSKLFPIILSDSDSTEVDGSKSFEYRLQVAMERSLNKYGMKESISQKNEFEQYFLWLKEIIDNPDKEKFCDLITTELESKSDFSSIEELLEALEERDNLSITALKKILSKYDLPPPQHCDTVGYYESVLSDLKKLDPSIKGIVIFWDEFTTVLNVAGKHNDVNLLAQMQKWAQKAENNIFLFLISHQSPEALRGKYKAIDDNLAKISDRFEVINIQMDKITTYHLIAESLEISDRRGFESYLNQLGFDKKNERNLKALYENVFTGMYNIHPDVLKKTIPLHPYSVFVAAKLADLIGSAERSIFSLLHSEENIEQPYGTKIGFNAFLDLEPSNEHVVWYTIDQVFDFFYENLTEHEFDKKADANVIKPLTAFTHYYEKVRGKGESELKVYKAIVLMEMLHAKAPDVEKTLLATQNNLISAFKLTGISDIQSILTKLSENDSVLMSSENERTGEIIYKTKYGGYEDAEIGKEEERLKTSIPYAKFLQTPEIKESIHSFVKEQTLKSPRIQNNYFDLPILSPNEFQKSKLMLKENDKSGLLQIVVVVPQNNSESNNIRKDLENLSQKSENSIFILYDGEFEKRYSQWIHGRALVAVGEKQTNHTMIEQGIKKQKYEIQRLVEDLTHCIIYFKGTSVTKVKDLSPEIPSYIKKVYSKGFDHLKYDLLWKNPKKYSIDLLINYGVTGSKREIEESGQIQKRMMDLFIDENENVLIDSALRLKVEEAYVTASPLYEIFTNINKYIAQRSGQFISLNRMIDTLRLERSPYGLCGWTESLILAYSLAPHVAESRLEVKIGNGSSTKDSSRINDALINVVKGKNNDYKIRFGSLKEIKFAKRLIQIFSLGDDVKPSLSSVINKIREDINEKYSVPLWILPYGYEGEEKQKLNDLIENLNPIVTEPNLEKEYSEDEIDGLMKKIEEIENFAGTNGVWLNYLNRQNFRIAFKNFVDLRRPGLLGFYTASDDLIKQLNSMLNDDAWAWRDARVSDELSNLQKSLVLPDAPTQIGTSQIEDGISLIWSAPTINSGIPAEYIIERKDKTGNYTVLDIILATSTQYCDRKANEGEQYFYQVIAKNPAGKSKPSEEVEVKVLLNPPKIALEVSPESEYFILEWEKPDEKYEIVQYILQKGNSISRIEKFEEFNSVNITSYQDANVDPDQQYYYQINLKNLAGKISIGPKIGPLKLLASTPPTPPMNVNGFIQNREINISWFPSDSGNDSVQEYAIYQIEVESGIKMLIGRDSSQKFTFIDVSAKIGEKYQYEVIARNCAGSSPSVSTDIITIPPLIPEFIASGEENDGNVKLKWEKPDEIYQIKTIEVFRGESEDEMVLLNNVSPNVTEFIDSNIPPGKTLYYNIVFKNLIGDSRRIAKPLVFSLGSDIGLINWKNGTEEIITSNTSQFISELKRIIKKICDENNSGLSKKSQYKIDRLMEVLEELGDE